MRRRGRVQVEPIDIDLVLEEKYPNRKAERELAAMAAALTQGPVTSEFEALGPELARYDGAPDGAADAFFAGDDDLDLRSDDLDLGLGPVNRPTAPARPRSGRPSRLRAPTTDGSPAPWQPLPCEPADDEALFAARSRQPLPARAEGAAKVASPYEELRRRRDRIARQAVIAFSQVHELRTASLRRAAEAEHQAGLATTARVRAARIARNDVVGNRPRSSEVPGTADAFEDVHRLRVEALRSAQQAEHGADAVARARERAQRLLAEQRRLESEMSRLKSDARR